MRDLEAQVAALEAMASSALREEWQRLTGTPAPNISPAMLRLALAWEIQARALGSLPRQVRQKLEQLAEGRTRTETARAGMRLVRTWNGVTHFVLIDEAGVIRWNGKVWRSLSDVARAITGTRWSGPAFFGLKKRIAA